MKHIIVFFINFYQRIISPFLPQTCRFQPTCSTYCKEAVIKYGAIKGSWLCLKRVIRCHPWNPGGYDPLP